jgi:hypothetical protein
MSRVLLSILALGLLSLTLGCATSVGPAAVPRARFDYNQAVARSWDEQLLLNLVRLRYRDTPHFLELSSVVAQYERAGSASISPLLVEGSGNEAALGLGVDLAERPTLTFTPLEGTAFVQQLLTPLKPADLVLLSQAGWSVSRLMDCCVQEMRGPGAPAVRNALRAAGPTPQTLRPDEYADFKRLSRALRELQLAGGLKASADSVTGSPDGETRDEVLLSLSPRPGAEEALTEVREILGLDPEISVFHLVHLKLSLARDEIALAGRSLMGVLFFLSQAVEVPPRDETARRVTVAVDPNGQPLDWNQITGGLIHIRTSDSPPETAAMRVHYRGAWFYIEDSDLQSKTTFLLLSQLFSLQAGSASGRSPLLTVSASGG